MLSLVNKKKKKKSKITIINLNFSGKVLGYHVNLPCKTCLAQENNGHYWMFRSSEVRAQAIFIEGKETHTEILSDKGYSSLHKKKSNRNNGLPLVLGICSCHR